MNTANKLNGVVPALHQSSTAAKLMVNFGLGSRLIVWANCKKLIATLQDVSDIAVILPERTLSGSCAASSETLIGYGTALPWCLAQRSQAHAIRQRVRNPHPVPCETVHGSCISKAVTSYRLLGHCASNARKAP